jgi:hypothetical protein
MSKIIYVPWFVWRKTCTYLESRLVLSPNASKWASTRASSPRNNIRCVQNDYWAYGTFGANYAPQTDGNELRPEPRHLGVPSSASKMISNPMVRLSKPCTYLARMLTPSSNGPKQDSTWPTSPRSSIECVQNDFRANVRSVQTVHLSCIKIGTISKWTKTSFH